MFRALNAVTGELAISLDYYTPEQLDKAFRDPAKEGKLLCPICKEPVILRQAFDSIPHFMHSKGSSCRQAGEELSVLKLRAALYRHLRREFGHGVTAEHDLTNKKVPRSVDCWVEVGGKKFGYWLVETEIPAKSKRLAIRSAIETEGAVCHFVFADWMRNAVGDGKSTIQLAHTEKLAKVCTPYDVLDGAQLGGSLHYIGMDGDEPALMTYRTLRNEAQTDVFTGFQKQHPLAETEVCPNTGFLIHPGEKTHAEIVRTRKAREQFAEESQPNHPEAVRRREWEIKTRRAPRTNETVSQIVRRLLRPRADLPTLELCREREAPCEFCGVVTRDWIVFTGKTGKCKCRTCMDRMSAEKWRAQNEPPENGKVA